MQQDAFLGSSKHYPIGTSGTEVGLLNLARMKTLWRGGTPEIEDWYELEVEFCGMFLLGQIDRLYKLYG